MSLNARISITRGNIVDLDVECVVNAANQQLHEGGGVCGAIFDAAGASELQAECDQIGGCPVGSAVITKGYRLRARWIIHAVGPVYKANPGAAPALLKSTYAEALKLAAREGIRSIAFSSISTGIYGFPIDQACPIAIETALKHCQQNALPEEVLFCCFGEADKQRYEAEFSRLTAS